MSEQNVDLSLSTLTKLVGKHLKLLLVIALIAMVVSAVVSLLLPEYYKSTVILFPTRTHSVILNESGVRRGNISDFGAEEEAEQMLQIINSEDLQERVIGRNNLYQHYEVLTDEPYARTKIRQTYNGNVSARRTKYNSVEISVLDKSPEMAANIANSIAEFVDSVKNQMIANRAKTSLATLDLAEARLRSKSKEINQNLDSLHSIGVMTVFERGSLLEAYGQATSSESRRELKTLMEINKKYGDEYEMMKRERELLTEKLMRFDDLRNQHIADTQIDIQQQFLVDKAFPADKKAFPIRWLIVAMSTFSAVLFTLILLIVRDNYKPGMI